MPWPSSATDSSISCASPSATTVIVPPSSVYRCAFEIRLTSTWRTRTGSASALGRPGGRSRTSLWSLASTRGPISVATSSISPARSNRRAWISIRPASSRATSSRSFTSSTRRSVLWSTTSTNSRSRSPSACDRPSSSTNPLIEVSGLRSSCEAVATKSLFIRSRRARSDTSRMVHTRPAPRAGGQPAGGGRQRAAVDLDRHVPGQPLLGLGQRAVVGVGVGADGQAGHELRRARVGRGHEPVAVGDHQGVAEALDRQRQAGPLGLEAHLRLLEALGHLVERGVQLLDLARPAGLDALVEIAARKPAGGLHQLVERAPDRPRQRDHQADGAQQRQQPGATGDQRGRARVVARLRAGLRAPVDLAGGQRGLGPLAPGQRPARAPAHARRGRLREPRLRRTIRSWPATAPSTRRRLAGSSAASARARRARSR